MLDVSVWFQFMAYDEFVEMLKMSKVELACREKAPLSINAKIFENFKRIVG